MSTVAPVPSAAPRAWAFAAGRVSHRAFLLALVAGLVVVTGIALTTGAYPIRPVELLAMILSPLGVHLPVAIPDQHFGVLVDVRLPRVLFGILTGAGLAASGAALQGLVRNPLADPTLIGISSGAALGAATVIVLGATALPGATRALGGLFVPLAAFATGLAVTSAVHALAHTAGRMAGAVLLLAGVAVTAAAEAGIGLYTYIANDDQLRNLAFWRLGSLGGASWRTLALAAPCVAAALAVFTVCTKALNALALGESAASHLGVSIARVKAQLVWASALAVGGLVAFTGNIGFIGLVAPHMVRLLGGPDHRLLLPGSALLGAILVVGSDVIARTALAPAELPIGIVTALVGVPFFIFLLASNRRALGVQC
jgi:iron complex transport system permease protein